MRLTPNGVDGVPKAARYAQPSASWISVLHFVQSGWPSTILWNHVNKVARVFATAFAEYKNWRNIGLCGDQGNKSTGSAVCSRRRTILRKGQES